MAEHGRLSNTAVECNALALAQGVHTVVVFGAGQHVAHPAAMNALSVSIWTCIHICVQAALAPCTY